MTQNPAYPDVENQWRITRKLDTAILEPDTTTTTTTTTASPPPWTGGPKKCSLHFLSGDVWHFNHGSEITK